MPVVGLFSPEASVIDLELSDGELHLAKAGVRNPSKTLRLLEVDGFVALILHPPAAGRTDTDEERIVRTVWYYVRPIRK